MPIVNTICDCVCACTNLTMEINLLTVLAVNTQDDAQCQFEGSLWLRISLHLSVCRCVCAILIALQGSEIQFDCTDDGVNF